MNIKFNLNGNKFLTLTLGLMLADRAFELITDEQLIHTARILIVRRTVRRTLITGAPSSSATPPGANARYPGQTSQHIGK